MDVYSSLLSQRWALAGLEHDLGSFFHYYSFTALASSLRINLQYQASAGGWCILYTLLTWTLVWLPLNPEWLPIRPRRVFTHRWIWFWCCSGAEVPASAWLMKKPHAFLRKETRDQSSSKPWPHSELAKKRNRWNLFDSRQTISLNSVLNCSAQICQSLQSKTRYFDKTTNLSCTRMNYES